MSIIDVIAKNKYKNTHGFSLIEIMATVMIVSFGLLGISKLQLSNYARVNDSLLSQKASFYGNALVQKLKANSALATSNSSPYVLNDFTDTPTSQAESNICISNSCDADNLAIYDMNTWLHKIKNNFPKGKAKIIKETVGSSTTYTISIQWQYKQDVEQYDLVAQI